MSGKIQRVSNRALNDFLFSFFKESLFMLKRSVIEIRKCSVNISTPLTHSHTCMLVLKHQENNLQFKGLAWIRGHILSLSSQRRPSLTPLKRSRISRWGVLRVKRRPCVTRTILPVYVCVCVCVCTEGMRGWTSASSISFPHPGLFHHVAGVFVSHHDTK